MAVNHNQTEPSQLFAIRMLLMRQDNSDAQLVSEIERIDEVARSSEGARNDRAVDQYVELAHDSIFQSAAHSMAAVGMLARSWSPSSMNSSNSLGERNRKVSWCGISST